MASPVPAKSQPLHNFSLPHHLTWKKSHTSTTTTSAADTQQRARTRLSTPPPPPPPSSNPRRPSPNFDPSQRQSSPSNASRRQPSPSYASRRHSPLLESLSKQSPLRESESESDFRRQRSPSCASRRQTSPSYAGRRHSPLLDSITSKQSLMVDSESESDFPSAALKASAAPEHSRSDLPVLPSDETKCTDINPKTVLANDKGKRSKIYIRFRKNKHEETIPDEDQDKSAAVEGGAVAEDEESMQKTWNLRPRRQLNKQSIVNGNGGVHKIGGSLLQENKSSDKNQLEGNGTIEKKEKKQEFSISLSLSRDEIEEDIYALTGSKPSRRPRKRHKTVQKNVESVLPGLWLGTITTDSYKVSEAPAKV